MTLEHEFDYLTIRRRYILGTLHTDSAVGMMLQDDTFNAETDLRGVFETQAKAFLARKIVTDVWCKYRVEYAQHGFTALACLGYARDDVECVS